MNLYEQRSQLNIFLLAAASLIVIASLVYTNFLARRLADQERKSVELWANAYKNLNLADDDTDIGFLFDVIKNNETVPVILTDEEGDIKAWRNFDSSSVENNSNFLKEELAEMRQTPNEIVIEIGFGEKNFIYYKESKSLEQLRFFPFIQLAIISLFVLVGYITITTTRSAEQNRVWVGMAKETAHQLGTPISSLMAWVEYLKMKAEAGEADEKIVVELEKDVNRLELVADRFSKIGSKPNLEVSSLNEVVRKYVLYFKDRASEKVKFTLDEQDEVTVALNEPLFGWVMENLLKNALDAMEGQGNLSILLKREGSHAVIEVKDSGKGIAKGNFKDVFRPGYSTKKRGWGLGLTLTKRIVENYHGGRIMVKESVVGKGTTFRVELAVAK